MSDEITTNETPEIKPDVRKTGRPLLFATKEELENKIDEYFDSCFKDDWEEEYKRDENGYRSKDKDGVYEKIPVRVRKQIKPVTVGGLAVFLNTSRETLRNYKEREEFFDTIKRALDFIEMDLENGMLDGRINSIAGIFNAKNNFGWKDKSEMDLDHTSLGKQMSQQTTFVVRNYKKPNQE